MEPGMPEVLGQIKDLTQRTYDRVAAQGETLAAHSVRLDHVEAGVREVRGDRTHDQRQGITFRASLTVAAVTVLASGAISALVNVLTR